MAEQPTEPLENGALTRRTFLLACLGVLIAAPEDAEAQRRRGRRRRRRFRRRRQQRRRARDAVKSGKAKPLRRLIQKFQKTVGGEVLDVRYRERGSARAYIFDVVFSNGRVARYVMDAGTEQIYTRAQARRHYGF